MGVGIAAVCTATYIRSISNSIRSFDPRTPIRSITQKDGQLTIDSSQLARISGYHMIDPSGDSLGIGPKADAGEMTHPQGNN